VKVTYRKLFLKELKKLKSAKIYEEIFDLVFHKLPTARSLREIPNIKPLKGYPYRFRIRVGDYRIGIEVHGENVEVMRVLHRKDFYKYFP